MARACRAMRKKYQLGMEEVGPNHSLTRAIQYCLDRLYLHRISLNMLTRQHLMVYGHSTMVENQVGVIHPELDVEAAVRYAYNDARMLCERCRAMRKKYQLGMEEVGPNHSLTRAIQYCLDRLYLHRISLNMLTRQHLMVYGHSTMVENQVGVIHPELDVEAAVQYAYND